MEGIVSVALTARELEIMEILWRNESGTVAEVRSQMGDDLAYTTVLSLLRTMHQKGYVKHVVEGRAHRFVPRIRRDAVRRFAVAQLVKDLFQGSPELVLTELVSDRRLSSAELQRIRDIIDKRLPRAGK
jgi:predicted transcriptional regulator